MFSTNFLIFIPLLFALVTPFTGLRVRNFIVYAFVAIIGYLSIENLLVGGVLEYSLPKSSHLFFIAVDMLLLVYFLIQGFKSKHNLVFILAIFQIVLYSVVLNLGANIEHNNFDIISDHLSSMMFLIINIVGGTIIIFALKYIESEQFSRLKKNSFIAILIFFIGIMNFIVTTNSIEIFFLLFEFTTLCSYLLIRYRGDELAVKNALRALWMNQIGGIAILISLIYSSYFFESVYFNEVIMMSGEYILVPIVFLIAAAYIKGAAFPFSNWLLGAMVAPTPVSAILHSATMVKIAPFLILKLSPSFTPFISVVVALFGTFVFLSASIMALNKDFFKEILGLSTIALLSLMMALGALGIEEATNAALILLMFHAVSKAILFLSAGVLEKSFHLKYISDIENLVQKSHKLTFVLIVGFASLTLPPFGAFIGKLMAIEVFNSLIATNWLYLVSFIFLIMGSVVLTLLYFKVTTKLLPKEPFVKYNIVISPQYMNPIWILLFTLVSGVGYFFFSGSVDIYQVLVPLILLLLTIAFFYTYKIKDAVRVKEYNCGEKDDFEINSYYFTIDQRFIKAVYYISTALIFVTLAGGL